MKNDTIPPTVENTKPAGRSERLLSLDVFRGLTIVAMILVNNPGSWGHLYWPLGHAAWHGWTPTDLVFPFFLFIVGTSMAYSFRRYVDPGGAAAGGSPGAKRGQGALYWRIVRRTLVLILLGLMLAMCGRTFNYLFGNSDSLELSTLRYPGVLQRIALVYFITSLIVLHSRIRTQAAIAAVLLLGYWALLAWLPGTNYMENLSPEGNVVRVVDRAVIGEAHMYTQARNEPTDPEGLLSTLPAIVTALLGYWTGLVIQRRGANYRTVAILIGCGAVLTALGLLWNEVLPINKKIWTSSYVLLSGGLAMIVVGGTLLKFDVWGWRRLARPWEIVGVNAIFVFVASGVMANLLAGGRLGGQSVKAWLYENLFTAWIGDPYLASLAYAVATVAFWWLVLWAMWRRGWAIRV